MLTVQEKMLMDDVMFHMFGVAELNNIPLSQKSDELFRLMAAMENYITESRTERE